MVEQLLEINTFVDVRDNLYELSLEKKEFWYGTPLILAGKYHGCSTLVSRMRVTYMFIFFSNLAPPIAQISDYTFVE